MFLIETLRTYIPSHKTTPAGWLSFNCPACHHFGHRPDRKSRGGLIFTNSSFSYNCFNCNFKTGWASGSYISKKTNDFFEYLNIPDEVIIKIKLSVISTEKEEKKLIKREILKYSLPKNSRKISDLIEENYDSDDFIKTLKYLGNRNINLLDWYDLYYSPEEEYNLKSRFIMPVKSNNQIVGWVARANNETSLQKYILQTNKNFLFNGDILFKKYRKFVIITEGNLDAISLDAIALMGNEATSGQINLLSSTNQKKILLPDKDESGKNLIEFAIDNNWAVSFPEWEYKDATEAVKNYGRIPSVLHILNNVYQSPIQIKIQSKKYFGE